MSGEQRIIRGTAPSKSRKSKISLQRKNPTGSKKSTTFAIVMSAVVGGTSVIAYFAGLFDKLIGNDKPNNIATPPPVSTPIPTLSATDEPIPETIPLTEEQIKFGLTEDNRSKTVDVDNIFVARFDINNEEKFLLINPLYFTKGYANVTDLVTQKIFDRVYSIDDRNSGSEINKNEGALREEFLGNFKVRFNDPNINVSYLGVTDLIGLVGRVEAYELPIDISVLDEMHGQKTLEEIVDWIIKYVPKPFWPIETGYLYKEVTNSPFPTCLDDVKLGDVTRKMACAFYEDGTEIPIPVDFCVDSNGNGYYQTTLPKSNDDPTHIYVCDNRNENINYEFFDSIYSGAKLMEVPVVSFKEFVKLPFAALLAGGLLNLTPENTIGDLIKIYEMLDEKYWYMPPKDVQTMKDEFRQLATDALADNVLMPQREELMAWKPENEITLGAPKIKLDNENFISDLRKAEITKENLNSSISGLPETKNPNFNSYNEYKQKLYEHKL